MPVLAVVDYLLHCVYMLLSVVRIIRAKIINHPPSGIGTGNMGTCVYITWYILYVAFKNYTECMLYGGTPDPTDLIPATRCWSGSEKSAELLAAVRTAVSPPLYISMYIYIYVSCTSYTEVEVYVQI